MQFFLSSYTLRVREQGKKKKKSSEEYLKLDKLPNQQDFFSVLELCLKGLSTNNSVDENHQNIIRITRLEVDDKNRKIYGIVESGVYGMTSKLVNVNTGKIAHNRNQEEAEILPFFFLIIIPKDRNEAIMLLEKVGNHGIKKSLVNAVKKYLDDKSIKISLDTNLIVLEQIVNQILSGGFVKKMRFIKYHIPSDIYDVLDDGHEEIELKREIVLSATSIPIKNKLKSFINQDKTVKELFEVKDNDYDKLKIEVDIAGRTKTIDLDNLFRFNNSINITDEIDINQDKHPSFESLESVFSKYCQETCRLIYGEEDF